MNPDKRRVLLETADDLDKLYEKHAHEIRMLGLNELYDTLTDFGSTLNGSAARLARTSSVDAGER